MNKQKKILYTVSLLVILLVIIIIIGGGFGLVKKEIEPTATQTEAATITQVLEKTVFPTKG